MAYEEVTWAYQDEVTSAKLGQMVENTAEHDHRSDGSQGEPWASEWTPTVGPSGSAGWSIVAVRHRLVLGGRYVDLEVDVTRTGAPVVAAAESGATPGNVFPDATVLTGLPAEIRPATTRVAPFAASATAGMAYIDDAGAVILNTATTAGVIRTGDWVRLLATYWRD